MANFKYKTRANSSPQKKPRVYFCCHPEDFKTHFESVADQILEKQNCTIWYADEAVVRDEGFFASLKQMQLFVMPVTTNLLCTENEAINTEFELAIQNHIPVLPLMQEAGLEELFNKKCGDLQFLDKNNTDITAIGYDEKLQKYLESVIIGDALAEQIRASFDAYVFLSYRKKDRRYARELIHLIHKNDFFRNIAIWYDEFLIPGENFNDSINEALQKSGLLVLTVTPNLVNEPNYIMLTEYPMARQKGKPILPVELVPTDRKLLSEKYEDIPNPVDAHNEAELSGALLESVKKMAIKKIDDSPEHNFFIGLAYLGGIDVEVDYEYALSLITASAEAGLEIAIKKLISIYKSDFAVGSFEKAVFWQEELIALYKKRFRLDEKELLGIELVKMICDLGDLWYAHNHFENACRLYLECVNIMENSVAFDEGIKKEQTKIDLGFEYDSHGETAKNSILPNVFLKLGNVYSKLGYEREACKYYEKAIAVQLEQIKAFPMQIRATSLSKVIDLKADSQMRLKEYVSAFKTYYDNYKERKERAKHPVTFECKRGPWLSCMKLGEAYDKLKLFVISDHYYKKAQWYCLKGIEEEPIRFKLDFLKDLSCCYETRGELYERIFRYSKAEKFYVSALTVNKELEEAKRMYQTKMNLIHSFCTVAMINKKRRRWFLAIENYKKALDMCRLIFKNKDKNISLYTQMVDIYKNMAAIYKKQKEMLMVKECYTMVVRLLRSIVDKNPTNNNIDDLANALILLGTFNLKELSVEAISEAYDLWDKLLGQDPASKYYLFRKNQTKKLLCLAKTQKDNN